MNRICLLLLVLLASASFCFAQNKAVGSLEIEWKDLPDMIQQLTSGADLDAARSWLKSSGFSPDEGAIFYSDHGNPVGVAICLKLSKANDNQKALLLAIAFQTMEIEAFEKFKTVNDAEDKSLPYLRKSIKYQAISTRLYSMIKKE